MSPHRSSSTDSRTSLEFWFGRPSCRAVLRPDDLSNSSSKLVSSRHYNTLPGATGSTECVQRPIPSRPRAWRPARAGAHSRFTGPLRRWRSRDHGRPERSAAANSAGQQVRPLLTISHRDATRRGSTTLHRLHRERADRASQHQTAAGSPVSSPCNSRLGLGLALDPIVPHHSRGGEAGAAHLGERGVEAWRLA